MTDFADISILPRTLGLAEAVEDVRERRELLVARVGARLIGIFAEEADRVTEWKPPTPLPHAPRAVIGLVCVRGNMLTVLDPLALLNERGDDDASPPLPFNFIIALGGDEQLALAVERVEHITEIFADQVEPLATSVNQDVIRGLVQMERELVAVLDVHELFNAALQGAERRRQRTK
jgi:purine-binding chemotaxis protein CheW